MANHAVQYCGSSPAEETSGVAVLVVDDHEGFRIAAGAVVVAADGFDLVGVAANESELRDFLRTANPRPELVLLDVNLGDSDGIRIASDITAAEFAPCVVLISVVDIGDLPADVLTSGATAFIPKRELEPASLSAAWAKRSTLA